jgi:hypothetical protein
MTLFAVWWGGLTLYAIVVVPIGTEIFTATGQGFVTQQVTVRLNWIGAVCLAVLLWRRCNHSSRVLTASWLVMVVALLVLFYLHATLDRMLDVNARSIADTEHFYAWHRYYLLVTSVQWVAGLIHLWALCLSEEQIDRSKIVE